MKIPDAAFGHPRGLLGRLGGMIMARSTGLRNEWIISLLAIERGGLIAIALQPVWARTESEVRKLGEELVELLATAGFRQTWLEFKPMKPKACVCALGIK